jgi:uncharacterized iron-regulated protein
VNTGTNIAIEKIETEQKVSLLNLELSQERIRDLERETARRVRWTHAKREVRRGTYARPLLRLLTTR